MKFFDYSQILILTLLQAQNCISYYVRDSKLILGDLKEREKLKSVDASEQNIEKLYNNTFSGAKNLEVLDLRSNSIKEIEIGAFRDLQNLRLLYLNDNLIKTIPAAIFDPLKNIEEIWLRNNQITIIENETFNKNSKLRKINLKNNKIVAIGVYNFQDLKSLQNLDVSDNVCIDKIFEKFSHDYTEFDNCYNAAKFYKIKETHEGMSPVAIFFICVVALLILISGIIIAKKFIGERRSQRFNGIEQHEAVGINTESV